MAYQDLGDGRVAVFASFGGQDVDPACFHNLVAHPDVHVEIGTETRDVRLAGLRRSDEQPRVGCA